MTKVKQWWEEEVQLGFEGLWSGWQLKSYTVDDVVRMADQ